MLAHRIPWGAEERRKTQTLTFELGGQRRTPEFAGETAAGRLNKRDLSTGTAHEKPENSRRKRWGSAPSSGVDRGLPRAEFSPKWRNRRTFKYLRKVEDTREAGEAALPSS